MKYLKYSFLLVLLTTLQSCWKYSFTSVSISENTKTFQVNYFQNNAPLIEPGLERDFKIALEEIILNQTKLDLVKSNGDLVYEGEIVEYRISPTTATANNTAAQNRLTIAVKVHFYDKNDPEAEFDQRFSFYFDYAGSAQLVGSQKDTAIAEIFERITQDVVNASLSSNW
ncbi:LPS assembly lipoprotein LptE [Flavobacteriaceae bacterium S0825]|uniref:LPS assembly lipoprotein LptE n=1 Tax=Gaetbulibacter sp. S0825 TaxID=2720084 RepID=UPI0014306ECA|nr:LptE family protein [Gaetbulibacter sp. S0825]MCK0108669.1 LPS assembly lipoprotein LptE [Flavobacteriaceae bacterium S0825]NIX64305.1 LptE family protein [Gaetbulibacter sp. S0825]